MGTDMALIEFIAFFEPEICTMNVLGIDIW